MKRRIMMGVKDPGLDPSSAPNGVYVQHINGRLYTEEVWDENGSSNVNGIAVISNNSKFVIELGNSLRCWSKSDLSLVPGVTTASSLDMDKDFSGLSNTAAYIDFYGPDGDSAFQACWKRIFKNGKRGYLGSGGEWKDVTANFQKNKFAYEEGWWNAIKHHILEFDTILIRSCVGQGSPIRNDQL